MPTTEPLHPALTEADSATETFFEAANEAIEAARNAPLNPLSEKLSAVKPVVKTESPSTQPNAPTPPPSGTSPQTTAKPAKIPGPPAPTADTPAPAASDEGNRASASSLPQPAVTDVPGPDDYRPGKGGAENWKKLHSVVAHWEQVAREQEKQLAALKAAPPVTKPVADPEITKRLDTLQAERDNLLARLEAVAVEKSPRFEAAFKPRVEAALAQAKAAVGPDRAKMVEEILSLPESSWRDQQLETILSDLGPGIRGAKLAQAVADLDRITTERQQLASRGSDLYKQWQSEEQAAFTRQQQEREATAAQVFTSELTNWQQQGYLKDEQDIALAKSVFSGQADFTDAARASIWAVVGPKLAAQSMAASKRVTELEAELAKFRSVQPTATGGSDTTLQHTDDLPDNIGYGDAIGRLVQQQGLLR